MGSCQPFQDDAPFADKVKTLEDDELLEIWDERQIKKQPRQQEA